MVHITTEEGQWTTKIAVEAARIVAQNLQVLIKNLKFLIILTVLYVFKRVLNTTKES